MFIVFEKIVCFTNTSVPTRSKMVAERIAVRRQREQDSRKYMTGDAGEQYSRSPGWDGEAETYFSYARRARQFVEGTKKQERYLGGPRLEAPLTGRAESAVEGCRPSWLSHEQGVEPMASWSTRHRNEYTKIRRALAGLQRAESTDDTQAPHSCFSPQVDQPWNWSERGTEEVMEWDDSSDTGFNTWSNWNWNSWKTNWDSSWNVTSTLRIEDYDEVLLLFLEPVLAWSSYRRVDSRQERGPIGPVGTSLEDTVSR